MSPTVWSVYMETRRALKRRKGLCLWCSEKRAKDRVLCAKCLKKNRLATARYAKKKR